VLVHSAHVSCWYEEAYPSGVKLLSSSSNPISGKSGKTLGTHWSRSIGDTGTCGPWAQTSPAGMPSQAVVESDAPTVGDQALINSASAVAKLNPRETENPPAAAFRTSLPRIASESRLSSRTRGSEGARERGSEGAYFVQFHWLNLNWSGKLMECPPAPLRPCHIA